MTFDFRCHFLRECFCLALLYEILLSRHLVKNILSFRKDIIQFSVLGLAQ
jgi:hypothetical protein